MICLNFFSGKFKYQGNSQFLCLRFFPFRIHSGITRFEEEGNAIKYLNTVPLLSSSFCLHWHGWLCSIHFFNSSLFLQWTVLMPFLSSIYYKGSIIISALWAIFYGRIISDNSHYILAFRLVRRPIKEYTIMIINRL
jgi:hypothetical protein